MAKKDFNVNLSFTADTKQVKAQLNDLQNQLSNLLNKEVPNLGLTKQIKEASSEIASLKVQLESATNVDTGKLDLGKFSDSLTKSGKSLKDYQKALSSLGPEGDKAFAELAHSISVAEVPLKRSSALMDKLAMTIKNTARWQISSSLLRGFIGTVESAYGYAQNLNESLNNIRIVTGQSADQMAEFARQANESARALHTTTTAYTDAALIFFQQGLTDDAVTERTDTVIKMANVTKDKAEDVSSYMTAIWNNFADGSESLEHYADVITALGAATASSSAEIAAGLEKFASIGETVGLSYDYATSALATVVATTRQSEDIVGTAFRTIFARMQSLQLGETLEDGTSLNKYSKALEAVGVNIKDQQGQLKNMDTILDELGEKWKTLEKDQQTALAQTIAGTRQYAQILALMNNWDFFKENLKIAQESEGTLQHQADIYAESWEAARKKVKASMQDLYDKLIDDKFFINLSNDISKVVDVLGDLIDGLGGVKGLLFAISGITLKLFKSQISNSIENIAYTLSQHTERGRAKYRERKKEASSLLGNSIAESGRSTWTQEEVAYRSQGEVQLAYMDEVEKMSKEQQKIAQLLLEQHNTLVKNVVEESNLVKESERQFNLVKRTQASQIRERASEEGKTKAETEALTKQGVQLLENAKRLETFRVVLERAFTEPVGSIEGARERILQIVQAFDITATEIEELRPLLVEAFGESGVQALEHFEEDLDRSKGKVEKVKKAIRKLLGVYDVLIEQESHSLEGTDTKTQDAVLRAGELRGYTIADTMFLNKDTERKKEQFEKLRKEAENGARSWVEYGEKAMSAGMALSSVEGLINSVSDGEASLTEILMSTGMMITSLTSLIGVETIATLHATAASEGFSAALATAGSMWLASPFAIAATAAIGIYGLVKAIDYFTTSIDEVKESLANVSQEYKETKDSLESMESELSTASARIDELNSKDNLSFVEQEELDKLKESNDLLEYQIELKKLDLKSKAEEKVEKSRELLEGGKYEVKGTYTEVNPNHVYTGYEEETADNVLAKYKKYNDLLKDNKKLTEEQIESYKKERKSASDKLTEMSEATIEHISSLRELKELDEDAFNAQGGTEELERWENSLAIIQKELTPSKWKDSQFDKILNSDKLKKDFEDIINKGKEIKAEDLEKLLGEKGFSELNRQIEESDLNFNEFLSNLNSKVIELQTTLEENNFLAEAIESFKTLKDIKDSLKDGGIIDEETLTKLKGYNEEIGNFFTLMADGTYRLNVNAEDFANILNNLQIQEFAKLSANSPVEGYENFSSFVLGGKSSDQLDYLEQSGFNAEKVQEWRKAVQEGGNEAKGVLQEISTAVNQLGEDSFNKAKESSQRLKEALNNALDPLDEDIDEKEFANLADYLQEIAKSSEDFSDGLEEDRDAAEDASEGILRFDKAIERTNDSIEEWSEILGDSTANAQDMAEAIEELANTYGDLLDIDGNMLSEEFLSSTDNLELLKQAINGDIDAYNELQNKAALDIITNFDVDDTALQNLVTDYDTIKDYIENNEIKVGENINDTAFLAACQEIVDAAVVTGQNAQEALSAMGVDAELVTDTNKVVDTKEAIGWEAVAGEEPLKGSVPNVAMSQGGGIVVNGNTDLTGSFPTVDVIPTPQTENEEKSITAYGLKIKTAKKKAGGNIKFKHSSHGGGSSKKSGGKKGGRGGGGKAKTTDTKSRKRSTPDRYHNINQSIQKVSHKLNMLNKDKDHLFGKELIKSLEKENALLQEQAKNYEKLRKELIKERTELKKNNKLGQYGAKYWKDGSISNYATVFNNIEKELDAAYAKYNKVVAKYNKMSKEQQEKAGEKMLKDAEKALQKAEDKYKDAQDNLKRLDEITKELQENEENQKELIQSQIENNLKIFENKFKIELDFTKAKKDFNEFLKKVETDIRKIRKSAKDWSNEFSFFGNQQGLSKADTQTVLEQANEIKEILDNPNYAYGTSGSLFNSRSEALEKYKEIMETASEKALEVQEYYEEAWNTYLDKLDQTITDLDNSIEKFSKVDEVLDHYEKISNLLKGEDSDAGMAQLQQIYEVRTKNSLAEQKALNDEIKFLASEQKRLKEKYGDEAESMADYEKIIESLENKKVQLNQVIESYIETIQNQFVNSVHLILTELDKSMTSGYGSNKVSERWNEAKSAAEGYYDEVEKIYQVEKMESSWENLINSTTNLKTQQYLKTIMDSQLKNLKEKTKLSEYDIGLAERELEIYRAQIALEDAQNNKNSMKLVRNESGDWSYQYVADQEDVANKQQDLLNALYDKYEYIKSASSSATESVLNLYKEAQEKLTSLMEEYKYSDEERRAELEEEYNYLYEYYYGEDGLIIQKAKETSDIEKDLNIATMETLWDLYQTDEENYKNMTEHEKELMENLKNSNIDSFRSLTEQIATDDGSFYNQIKNTCSDVVEDSRSEWEELARGIVRDWADDSNENSVRNKIIQAYDEIMAEVDLYDQAIVDSEEASNIEWTKVEEQVESVRDEVDRATESVKNFASSSVLDDLDKARDKVEEMKKAWDDVAKSIQSAITSLVEYLDTKKEKKASSSNSDTTNSSSQSPNPISGSGNTGASLNNSKVEGIAGNIWYFNSWGEGESRKNNFIKKFGQANGVKMYEEIQRMFNAGYGYTKMFEHNKDYYKKFGFSAFDTGGYTGNWNNGSGKLGILHAKELVLNKEDTANILESVSIVRKIKDNISNIMAGLKSLKPGGSFETKEAVNNKEQNFYIQAEFPNATNVDEIQEALLSLPTLASQYISANTDK